MSKLENLIISKHGSSGLSLFKEVIDEIDVRLQEMKKCETSTFLFDINLTDGRISPWFPQLPKMLRKHYNLKGNKVLSMRRAPDKTDKDTGRKMYGPNTFKICIKKY